MGRRKVERVKVTCETCGAQFERVPSMVRGPRSYCSLTCAVKATVGRAAPRVGRRTHKHPWRARPKSGDGLAEHVAKSLAISERDPPEQLHDREGERSMVEAARGGSTFAVEYGSGLGDSER